MEEFWGFSPPVYILGWTLISPDTICGYNKYVNKQYTHIYLQQFEDTFAETYTQNQNFRLQIQYGILQLNYVQRYYFFSDCTNVRIIKNVKLDLNLKLLMCLFCWEVYFR